MFIWLGFLEFGVRKLGNALLLECGNWGFDQAYKLLVTWVIFFFVHRDESIMTINNNALGEHDVK